MKVCRRHWARTVGIGIRRVPFRPVYASGDVNQALFTSKPTASMHHPDLIQPARTCTYHQMNSASQNFPHHLAVLRERVLHPTDYELAVHYFLEEFAGDADFVTASNPEQMPQLVA